MGSLQSRKENIMPTHVNKKASKPEYPVEDIKAYYDAFLYLVELPMYWPECSLRLERFFDTGHPVVSSQPQEFTEFCTVYQRVNQAAAKLGLEEDLNERMLRALARNLYYGSSRQTFYVRFLKGRIENINTISDLSSVIEVEERYQYYLYRKENYHKGRGIGPKFKTWLKNGGCPITFYSIMSCKKAESS